MDKKTKRRKKYQNKIDRRVTEHRLGIDIGRVIICPASSSGKEDTSFLGSTDTEAMKTPPAHRAFEVIAKLVTRFDGRVWLVSKCGPRIENRSRAWLAHQGFYDRTGVAPANLRFCKKRPDKAIHARELRLTHFIDDRIDVLRHLRDLVPTLLLFGHQKPRAVTPTWATPVLDWTAIESRLVDPGDLWDRRARVAGVSSPDVPRLARVDHRAGDPPGR